MHRKRKYYFIRHAESIGNAQGYHQGHADFELSDFGILQAEKLAERLSSDGINPDLLLSSQLSRASQTAEIIGARLQIDVELSQLWMERNSGKLNGMLVEETHEIYESEDIKPLYEPVGKTGESIWDLYFRAGEALQSLLRSGIECALVVTHGGLLNLVFYHIFGISIQADFRGPDFRIRNASISELHFDIVKQRWEIISINDVAHLVDTDV